MDLTWLFKYALPIITAILGTASFIDHSIIGVGHPVVIDQLAAFFAALTGAKASYTAHTNDAPGGGA